MRVILTSVAVASFLFACGSSSTTGGGGVGADGGPTSTGSSSSGGTFTGSCSSLGHTYNFSYTYVSGGTDCMSFIPMDQMQTIDPDAGPMGATEPGETCTTNLNGCSFSQSCSDADDAGDTEMFSVSYTVGGDGTIAGTESINVASPGFTLMCKFNVAGAKIN